MGGADLQTIARNRAPGKLAVKGSAPTQSAAPRKVSINPSMTESL